MNGYDEQYKWWKLQTKFNSAYGIIALLACLSMFISVKLSEILFYSLIGLMFFECGLFYVKERIDEQESEFDEDEEQYLSQSELNYMKIQRLEQLYGVADLDNCPPDDELFSDLVK